VKQRYLEDHRFWQTAEQVKAEGVRCTCDLDNWEPDRRTGHSKVCRIHKITLKRVYHR
jgi:hypothetical protein